MLRRLPWLCGLLLASAWAAALQLTSPPPLVTGGGEVVFLLFTLDNPDGIHEITLEPRFPEGFRLLSPTERQLRAGINLLPLSVEVGADVAADSYQLCLRLQEDAAASCATVTVTPRQGLTLDVPSEIYGDTLTLRLTNGGNQPRTLQVRSEGDVHLATTRVNLAPGDTRTLQLKVSGTGELRLHAGERLVLVRVRALDGRPPDKQLELAAHTDYNPLSGALQPTLTLQGELSDYARVYGRLWPEPRLSLEWAPLTIQGGRLDAPYEGWGMAARYGSPWGIELGAGTSESGTIAGAGLVHDGAIPGHLRLLYDGQLHAEGAIENLPLGAWRLGASLDGAGADADVEQPAHEIAFGLHYAYAGTLQIHAAFGEGEARGRLSYEHGQGDQLKLSLDAGPVNWTIAGNWQPFQLDWRVGYHDSLGPGRYGLQLGIRADRPLVGGSYALNLPWVPGLAAAAALQYAGDWQLGGALNYQLAPWSASLSIAGGEAGLAFAYAGRAFQLNLEGTLGTEPRLSLGASSHLVVPLPETAVTVFGGRSWAQLEGSVRLENGPGLPGLILDAGGRRVKSGPGGHYELWLPAGPATLRLLPGDAPQHAILPQPQDLVLAESEHRHLDLVLAPAGAMHLTCRGVPAGTTVGLNLFSTNASSLVGCGRTIGGLPAGRYRLEPFGLGPELLASHPATVEIIAGETATLNLELTRRPPPDVSRPELILRVPSLLVAAPGENLVLEADSNAPMVYATLPDGSRRALQGAASGALRLPLDIPWDYTQALYRVKLTAVAGSERLERQALIRIDPRRPLFETHVEPAHAQAGDSVQVRVDARYTPERVRLLGPDLALDLTPAGPGHYNTTFIVPADWQDDVTLTLVLEGPRRLEETYRFRVEEKGGRE